MIKVRIEDTDRNETYEYEGEGIVFAASRMEKDGFNVKTGAIGGFNKRRLKEVYKSIKGLFRKIYKGAGRVE